MTALSRVLIAKIVLTLAVWSLPLLLFPASVFEALGFDVPQPLLFFRLLGMAYLALVVGYAFGLQRARRGSYPAEAVWVGIVSNGGAFLILAAAAGGGAWSSWGQPARAMMWGSLLGTLAITAGLLVFGPWRRWSTRSDGEKETA